MGQGKTEMHRAWSSDLKSRIKKRIDELSAALNGKEHIVVVSRKCPACIMVLHSIRWAVESGLVKVIYQDSEEFEKLSKEVQIKEVPSYLIKEGGEYRKMDLVELLYLFGT